MTPVRWAALRAEPSPARLFPRIALVSLFRLLFSMGALSGDTPASSATSSSQESSVATSTGMDAFEAFFWRYERDILGYLWRLTGDEQAAYDLSQETFVRAWQRFETLQHYDQPRAWLFRVASNLGINHLRGRSRRGEHAAVAEEIQNIVAPVATRRIGSPRTTPSARYCANCRRNSAPPWCSATYTASTSAEAADALGLSHGSLKMSLWRGRERFRQEYQREGGAE